MNIEILDFKKEMRDGSKVHGHLKISVNVTFVCWLTVLQNSKGGFFFCVPSVRIEEKFAPAFEFTKLNFTKEVYEQVKKQFEADWA